MYLPTPTKKRSTRHGVTEFRGLDSHLTAPAGWFFKDCNVSSDEAPALTVRRPRRQIEGVNLMATAAVVIEDILCTEENNEITFRHLGGGVSVPAYPVDRALPGKRLLIPCSYYLLVWPDKIYINVLDPDDRGRLDEESPLFGTAGVQVYVCDKHGKHATVVSKEPPDHTYVSGMSGGLTGDGDLWLWTQTPIDNDMTAPRLFLCHETEIEDGIERTWELVDPYIELSLPYPYAHGKTTYGWLKDGETVEIRLKDAIGQVLTDTTINSYDITPIIGVHTIEGAVNAFEGEEGTAEDGNTFIYRRRTISFRFPGVLDFSDVKFGGGNNKLHARRIIPDVDCAVTLDGRVYGAFRGVSPASGEDVNEIYISAADDFKRFFRLEDTDADPVTMSVVEPGAFHAAAVVGGVVTFWKDRHIVTVGGSSPGSFYLNAMNGSRPQFAKSLCLINGYAYYLTAGGEVVAYYGGNFTTVSERLGTRLQDVGHAEAGTMGGKYYLAATHRNGKRYIYVYDTSNGLWHTESQPPNGITAMAEGTDGLYLIEGGSDTIGGRILLVGEGEANTENPIPDDERKLSWSWETGMIGLDTPRKKYINRVEVRLIMEEGAQVTMWVEYDSCPERHLVWQAEAERTRTVSSRMVPRRCDHLRLILEGRGNVTLLGLFYDVRLEDR